MKAKIKTWLIPLLEWLNIWVFGETIKSLIEKAHNNNIQNTNLMNRISYEQTLSINKVYYTHYSKYEVMPEDEKNMINIVFADQCNILRHAKHEVSYDSQFFQHTFTLKIVREKRK